ncbi:MAG: GNAT family N-acetyltransferase [Ignavibacteriales bacterium]|nr:MAG: GNAT family N-acetyltransferase [Ignavibacteriales bacterium]
MIDYREISESDSKSFLDLMLKLDEETDFMMYEVGERSRSVQLQSDEIKKIISSNNSTIYLALDNKIPVGFIVAEGGTFKRNAHCCYLAIGVLKNYSGRGIGKTLFSKIFDWGDKHNIIRFELTVMCHNEAAVNLYKKLGFEIEGVKRTSLIINGKRIDEFYMSKVKQ